MQLGAPTLQSIEADFGDGRGYLPATWGQPLRATYTSSGTKRVKVRFSYLSQPSAASTVSYESQFDLFVAAPATATARTAADPSIYFAAQPGQAAGTMYIHYASKHAASATLTKPFIVAEGYDRSAVASHTAKNYSIGNFLKEIATSQGTSNFDLRGALEDTGDYDIVFIDYENGTDDILLNAGPFKRVLDYVNTHKDPAAHEQNVVMGMSMGGLIARYKLAQMEKAAPGSTDTRLLLLQDSPQRGANFPLGLSALIRQAQLNFGPYLTGDIDVIAQEVTTLLDQPATQQLLLYQTMLRSPTPRNGGSVFNSIVDYRANTFIEGDYRTMIAYQAPYKIVAVSQGSQCGVGLFAPYTEMVKATGYFNLFNLPFVFAGSNGISGEVIVNAIPANGQANRVSGLHLIEQTQLFFGLITIKVDLVRDNFSCPTGLLPLDGAAGGTEPIGNAVGGTGSFLAGTAYGHSYIGSYALVPAFSFIATPSGLDVTDFTVPALSARYINGLTSYSNSRTSGFLAQERTNLFGGNDYNVPHLTFTARNGEFIFDKMEGKQLANSYCSSECTPFATAPTISGPDAFCLNSSATNQYTIANLPAGVTVAWSATTTAGTVSPASYTGPTYSLSASSATAGTITVQAVLSTASCTLATLQLPVAMGSRLNYTINTASCAPTITVAAPGYLNVTLTVNGDQVSVGNGAQYQAIWQNRQLSVSLTGTDKCTGQSLTRARTYTEAKGQNCAERVAQSTQPEPAATPAAYPNPADDFADITLPPATNEAGSEAVRLYDSYGRLRLEQASHGARTVRLHVAGVPAGFYVLQVMQHGAVVSRQRLQVAH